jgi:hypothetical protein
LNLNIVKFYQDHYVRYVTEGSKHSRPGWVQTACPHCSGHSGEHLGFNIQFSYFNCWRCGPHPVYETLAKLTGLSVPAIKKELQGYRVRGDHQVAHRILVRRQQFKLPSDTRPLRSAHKKYLAKRNYDANKLQSIWGEMYGTGTCSPLDGIDYKYRLLIPITLDERVVSFQARDITGKSFRRYMACPKSRELLDHKHTLYGLDQCGENKWVMLVEGITDAWRMGPGAAATFGIEFTKHQVCRIVDKFEKAFVVYDDDPQAVKQARKLQSALEGYNVPTEVLKAAGDPDTFSVEDRLAIWQYITQHEK